MTIKTDLNLSELNLDGSHAIAKKGGEAVAYQGRKKAKTTNILPITDYNGSIVATTGLIADKLETDLDALPSGPRDLPARQRTLRATQEWSYNLLSADEKILFTNLAVFTGGFTLEAVRAVRADQVEGNIINIVASLVDRNLVFTKEGRDGEMYFTMLETTRQVNKERLVSTNSAEKVHWRYAEYYLNLAEQAIKEFSSEKNRYWFIRLQIERNNIRSSCQWFKEHGYIKGLQLITALRSYWRNYGYSKEGLGWIETILEKSRSIPDALRASAFLTAGDYCLDLDQFERSENYLRKALKLI
jgi:predicted ATPase